MNPFRLVLRKVSVAYLFGGSKRKLTPSENLCPRCFYHCIAPLKSVVNDSHPYSVHPMRAKNPFTATGNLDMPTGKRITRIDSEISYGAMLPQSGSVDETLYAAAALRGNVVITAIH
jgi:hypothetical protein